MRLDWRAISGPALTAAATLIAIFADHDLIAVLNPAPLLVCVVAYAGSLSGLASGMTSAVIAVIGSALFFLSHRATPDYDTADLVRLAMLSMTAAGTAAITGLLRQRLMDMLAFERTHHLTAARCRRHWTRSTSASCCSMLTPARNSSTAPSAIISRCRTRRPTLNRRSSH